ncbi:signal peptidase I [Paenactinomyces guangxiensis]|uniref:Signal peptidase I n=1 Tax=Paenactinomyces guangxiensis TaxID=1490290 RepID=A0A7W2A8L4_9BACL|nr:signal peptidase I [Paenactinomyces guangxiensis]MBA4495736.1 signal peptidase I [Paenactinomyces guangxiensis]MBH8592725.1 signal peptidase I [Paenactinomyces guangxiensis]
MKEVYTWFSSITIGVTVALIISIFVFQPTKVQGSSMEPTLHDNNRIYVSKLPRALKYQPNYGDIVIIDSRINRERTLIDDLEDSSIYKLFTGNEQHNIWVKRVIGKPGDTIEFKNNKIYRNGKLLEEDYIKESMMNTPNEKYKVPENHIFVMGDNRNNSRDSREIGYVPLDHVLGVKLF